MIRVNLIVGAKPFQAPKIAGMDLSYFNWKGVILVYLISLGVDLGVSFFGDELKAGAQQQRDTLNNELMSLKKTSKSMRKIEQQIQDFREQEKRYKARIEIAKQIIQNKKNPMEHMLYISKNIPKSVWVDSMNFKNGTFTVNGQATNYKNIGDFLQALKSSTFFSEVQLKDTKTTSLGSDVRVENFELTMKARSF